MAEYTPTTDEVRAAFIDSRDFAAQVARKQPPTDEESVADFDRWLAEVRREAAEKALAGQDVPVEWGVGYGDRHEAAPSREDAEEWIADDDAWNPGEERWLVIRQVGTWTRAAASPEGRGRDDHP